MSHLVSFFRELKTYIKTLCCFPERCNIEEYEAIMADFRNSEKVRETKKSSQKTDVFFAQRGPNGFRMCLF